MHPRACTGGSSCRGAASRSRCRRSTTRRAAGSWAASAGSPSSTRSREPLPPRKIDLRVDEVPVAVDVAALASDDQEHELAVRAIRDLPVGRRLDVNEPSFADLVLLALDGERRGAAVDEVQLVLRVVEVVRPFVVRRKHKTVDAESGDAEGAADLAEPGGVA